MGRPKNISNMYKADKSNVQFSEGQKSKGILDDFAQRKVIDSKEGTIQHTPTNAKDIVNKEFVDTLTTNHPHQNVNTTASPTFDELTITKPTQNWKFTSNTVADLLSLQAQKSGAQARLWFMSADGDGTDNTLIDIFAVGTPTDLTGQKRVTFGYAATRAEALIQSTTLPLNINAMSGGNEQIYLKNDGTTEFNVGEVAFAHEINTKDIQTVGLIYATGNINGATLTARNGFTGTGAYTNFTVVGGIITGAS